MRRPGSGKDGLMATLNECSVRHGQACIRLADYDKAKESFGKVKSEFSQCRRLFQLCCKGSRVVEGREQGGAAMVTEVRFGAEEEEGEGVEDVQGDVWKRLQARGLGVNNSQPCDLLL